MSTVVNYQNRHESNLRSKPRSIKKTLFSKLSAKTALHAEDQELLKAAIEARNEWIENNSNFDYVSDELLIDYYTYRIKASEARYSYYLQLLKEKGLSRYL